MLTVRPTATRDVITVLIRGWKLIVGSVVAFGLIALTFCLLQKPVYEASTTLYVTSGTKGEGRAQPYEDVMGAVGRVTSYSKLIYSDTVLAGAVKASGLNMTLDQARAAVSSSPVPESEMLTVTARDQDGEVAQRFASALGDSMIHTIAALEVPNGGGPPSTRLSTVTPATLNPKPASPTTSMNVTVAMFGGFLAGVATALTRERLNNTIRDERDIQKVVGERPLGCIPHDRTLGAALTTDFDGPGTAAAGAFRHLRTALAVAHSKRSLTTLLVTSPREGEGKSTVALNLAAAFAESGTRVVLVDADLGNPAVAKRMGNGEAPGLADLIHSQIAPLQLSAVTMDGLKVISAGRIRDNDAAGLLASSACGKFFKQLAESFDYVIVDSPSLLNGPAAQAAACWADGVIVVTRQGRSKISECYGSVNQLSDIDAELVGVVLNDVRPPSGSNGSATPSIDWARRRQLGAGTRQTTPTNGSPTPKPNWSTTKELD